MNSAVRVRRGNSRFVVSVTHNKRLSQGKVYGHVLATVVANTVGRVGVHPLVNLAMVPGGVIRLPAVRTGQHALRAVLPVSTLPVQVPRHKFRRVVRRTAGCLDLLGVNGLVEDTLASVVRDVHVRVLEAAHTCHRAEIVVKGTVLLHEQHNVFNVFEAVLISHSHCDKGCQGSKGLRDKHVRLRVCLVAITSTLVI